MNEFERLCEENLGLVHFVINRDFRRTGYPVAELDSIGYIGLVKAAKSYNPKKAKFSTYAVNGIKFEINKFLRLQKMQKRHISKKRLVSLERTFVSDKGGEIALSEFVPDEKSGRPFEKADSKMTLNKILSELNERELFVVQHYFGLGTYSKTSTEIGEIMGVSKSTVAQIKDKALFKMREVLNMEHTEITKSELAFYIRSIRTAMGWRWEDMEQKTGISAGSLANYARMKFYPRDPEKVVSSIRRAVKEEMQARREAKQAI
jgi:RNA polymerase sporulation-specific sigma factor